MNLLLFYIFGIAILAFATYEDIKYRAVTPLPLATFAFVALSVHIYLHNYLYFYFAFLLSVLALMISVKETLKAKDGNPFLPEGDAWLLVVVLLGCIDFKGTILFWLTAAFAELGLRLGLIVKLHSLKALDVRTPFAPVALVAYMGMVITRTLLGV